MCFLDLPFIPKSRVALSIADYRLDAESERFLSDAGVEVVKTVPCHELPEALNGHPDMLMHPVGGNRIVMAPNIFDRLAPALRKKGFAVTKGATWLARNYPSDIAYNVLRVGRLAFHNARHTDPELLKEFEKDRVRLIHLNQGYSKCSACILDETHIITTDYKMAKTVEKFGIDCLLIKPEGIRLTGLNYGFIGGASGLLAGKRVAFAGDPGRHADGKRIADYLNDRGFDYVILNKGEMTDIGSIIPLRQDSGHPGGVPSYL